MMNDFGNHGMGMGWGWIIGIILLLVVFWIIVKTLNQSKVNKVKKNSPLDILKERYAMGEIDREEFEKRKKDLM